MDQEDNHSDHLVTVDADVNVVMVHQETCVPIALKEDGEEDLLVLAPTNILILPPLIQENINHQVIIMLRDQTEWRE